MGRANKILGSQSVHLQRVASTKHAEWIDMQRINVENNNGERLTLANLEKQNSFAGPKFRERMRTGSASSDNDHSWMHHIPVVEVSVKVYIITDVNLAEQTFRACFTLYLEWFDPSVWSERESEEVLENHFVPNISFENDVDEVQVIGVSAPRMGDMVGHMKFLRKFIGTFRSRANVQPYPFDHQFLNIIIKSKRVFSPDGKTQKKVVLFNPMRFQRYGHRIDANADWLAEWELVRIRGANLREIDDTYNYNDQYVVQIEVRRESLNTSVNSTFVIFVVTLLSNAAFSIPIDELADRISLDLTAFLTVVAFKWIISASLPKVPYMTTLDIYIFLTFLNLFLQGVYFFVVAMVFTSLDCESATIFTIDNVSSTEQDGNCYNVAVADWVMTVLSILFVIAAQVYYIIKWEQARQKRFASHDSDNVKQELIHNANSGRSGGGREPKIHPAVGEQSTASNPREQQPQDIRLQAARARFNFVYSKPYYPKMPQDQLRKRTYEEDALPAPNSEVDSNVERRLRLQGHGSGSSSS